MKTPEEIKKGLECCIKYMACAPAEECCDLCPFHGRCGSLEKDVLAYIQQLEAQNAELVRKTEQLKEGASFTLTVKEQDVKGAIKKAYKSFEIDGKTLPEWIKLLADYKRQDWIDVHDALPGMDENVLFHPMCNEKSIYIGQFSYVGKSGAVYFAVRSGKRKVTYSATHWMPMPEPPMEETGHV